MNEDRAKDGVEHLQSAALEVISAVRAFLDVAEELVRDPGKAAALANDLVDLGRMAAGVATAERGPAGTPPSGDDPSAERDERTTGVTRIRVS